MIKRAVIAIPDWRRAREMRVTSEEQPGDREAYIVRCTVHIPVRYVDAVVGPGFALFQPEGDS